MDSDSDKQRDWSSLYKQRFGVVATEPFPAEEAVATSANVLGRRTLRRYLDRQLDDGLIRLLLMAAQSAPAKSDLQQYSIVQIKDPALREKIAELVPSMPWLATAPVFFIFCGDIRRNRQIASMRGYQHANDNVDTFMNAAVDAGISMATMVITAESLGLGCCPISAVRNHMHEICELLAIPDGVFPVAGLTVGWPEDSGYMSMRLPPELVVHEDRYDDSALSQALPAYDQERRRRYPIKADRQRHVDRYGVDPECTWSENAARQLSVPERNDFRQWLASQSINLK